MINLIIITALTIIGVYYTSQKGMFLYPIRYFLLKVFAHSYGRRKYRWYHYEVPSSDPEHRNIILKPLIDCPPCMSSFWGILVYVIFGGVDVLHWTAHLKYIAFIILGTAGLTTLLFELINWLKSYYEN